MANIASRRTDEQYYQVAPPRSFGERVAIMARDRIYDDMIRYCRPGPDETILDAGVSDVVTDAANMLERKYPHPSRITAAGLGEGDAFSAAYPQVNYRRIEANRPMPFADKAFDVAVSNAVLEHVGSGQNQQAFVAELARVAKRVFISVPNRYFPVEHHTLIPLLHFWRPSFALACRWLGKTEWTDEQNLILMSWRRLAALVPVGANPIIGHTGIRLGAFSSNLLLYLESPAASRPGGPG
ncbi:MAG: methyltransferase domain-containing protein [Alphaproteobacteria bacterium]|nr:methyltransferase domain-containing protein [Alphaproteobacteria bacterium]